MKTSKNNNIIGWTIRDSVQAKMRMTVKKMLKKSGYPPDKTPRTVEVVLEQRKLMCENESL